MSSNVDRLGNFGNLSLGVLQRVANTDPAKRAQVLDEAVDSFKKLSESLREPSEKKSPLIGRIFEQCQTRYQAIGSLAALGARGRGASYSSLCSGALPGIARAALHMALESMPTMMLPSGSREEAAKESLEGGLIALKEMARESVDRHSMGVDDALLNCGARPLAILSAFDADPHGNGSSTSGEVIVAHVAGMSTSAPAEAAPTLGDVARIGRALADCNRDPRLAYAEKTHLQLKDHPEQEAGALAALSRTSVSDVAKTVLQNEDGNFQQGALAALDQMTSAKGDWATFQALHSGAAPRDILEFLVQS